MSQIQKKKKKWWNCGITNTNIFPKNLFWAKKLLGGCSKLED